MTTITATLLGESQMTGLASNPKSSDCQIFRYEFSAARPSPVPNSVSLDSLIEEFESDPESAVALTQARKDLAATLYADEPNTLTALRLSAGLSQMQLATQVGTSQPHIARVEGGRTDPSTDLIARIANALAIPEKEVFAAIRTQRSRQ